MCPGINLLRTYKVYPRKVDFNYMTDKFFIYVYLNPFTPLQRPLEITVGQQQYCFAYLPIYIGKGTGAGYRQNQHLAAYRNNRENNVFKVAAFKHIEEEMAKAAATQNHSMPWNWKEYQQHYVVVLETFEDPKSLLEFEMELINSIGTVPDKTGPLTNKIKNAYAFNNLSSGRSDII